MWSESISDHLRTSECGVSWVWVHQDFHARLKSKCDLITKMLIQGIINPIIQ